jgi:hypothetical protein
MKWTFRSKLMTAFLLFGLVPTLIMTFVTNQATDHLTDSAARLVYRASTFAAQSMGRSPVVPHSANAVRTVSGTS